MKKIQMTFAVAAVLFAVIGVLANQLPGTTYYRAADTNPGDLGLVTADCSIEVTRPCLESTSERCIMLEFTQLGNEELPTQKIYSISKISSNQPCEAVRKGQH